MSAEAEASFRQKVTSEFPPLCADSLPPDGPVARLLDVSAFHVKLRLKEGLLPQDRRPSRIPGSYRLEMEKIIAKLLEFKLIEPSFSLYSNPVFLVPKPSLRDGSPGGLTVPLFLDSTLDEDSRPLISFNTPAGTYMGTCVPMGLLTACQEM